MKISQAILFVGGTCVAAVQAQSPDLAKQLRRSINDINSPHMSEALNMSLSGKALDNSEATLILNATAKGSMDFSGGCTTGCDLINLNPSDNFTSLVPPKDLDDIWIGVSFDNLVLHADFALNLHPTQPTHEIIQTIGEIKFKLDLAGLASATLTFTLEFHGWMNNTKAQNFTYGFDVKVPDNSAIIFPLEKLLETESFGFNESTVIPGILSSTIPNPAFDFQYSIRPQISFSAQENILTSHRSYNASLYADIPSLNLGVSQVQNVNAKCEPSPAGAPTADVFTNLTHVTPSVGFDLVLNNDSKVSVLANSTLPLPTSCLEFFPKQSKLAAPSKVGEKSSGSALEVMSVARLVGFGLLTLALL